jgi:hypothetical protein
MRKTSARKISIPDIVWNKVKEKFGSNIRYEVPNTGYPIPAIKSTKWGVGLNINFAPWLFVFDQSDNTYLFREVKYSEKEFIRILDLLSFV